MNGSAVATVDTVNGWEGHFRPVWASTFRKVQLDGKTAYFRTALAAEVAAWRILYAIEQPVMIRDGDILCASDADATFPTLKPFIKQRGKSRKVEVERKAVRA